MGQNFHLNLGKFDKHVVSLIRFFFFKLSFIIHHLSTSSNTFKSMIFKNQQVVCSTTLDADMILDFLNEFYAHPLLQVIDY